jgi:hypothetical protein
MCERVCMCLHTCERVCICVRGCAYVCICVRGCVRRASYTRVNEMPNVEHTGVCVRMYLYIYTLIHKDM